MQDNTVQIDNKIDNNEEIVVNLFVLARRVFKELRRSAKTVSFGLIYGMGHAVYSISDPRERIFKSFVTELAQEKDRGKDLMLYNKVEQLAPEVISAKRHIYKGVSPNVDFYSGFVYNMLGIPEELYTPLFAIARITGWSAHHLEELVGNGKIIRPSYLSVMEERTLD